MAYDTWYANKYADMIQMLVQQKNSPVADSITKSYGFDNAEFKFVDQCDSLDFNQITDRLGKTNWEEQDQVRRRISKEYFAKSIMYDNFEKLNRQVDATSKLTQSLVAGAARKRDEVVIAAMGGTAYSGKSGGTSVSFPSSQKIAAGAAGLTVAKLREAIEMMAENNVDDEQVYFAFSPKMRTSLLATTEVTSSDYNSVKTLVSGEVDTFLGMKFVLTNQLEVDGSDARLAYAYVPSAVELAIAREFEMTADRLPDYNNAVGFNAQLAMGAARLEEKKIIQVACTEA